MVRLARVCPVGIPQHIIQRGNNRQVCFDSEQDFAAYVSWLKDYAKKYQVDIHAWVLMTNRVHLLCTPRIDNAVSRMMQELGRHYVRYFNVSYRRRGTLWEGRFKSCLVQEENYLLQLYRYIEMNPIRAWMATVGLCLVELFYKCIGKRIIAVHTTFLVSCLMRRAKREAVKLSSII